MSATTEQPAWYRAATVDERITTAQPCVTRPALELALKRLQRWRQLAPFQDGPLFAERLSRSGLEESDLIGLLGETDTALRDRLASTPLWLSILDQAFHDHPSPADALGSLPSEEAADYLQLAAPLLARVRTRLRREIRALARRGDDLPLDLDTAEKLFTSALPRQMHWTLARTVALELYISGLEGKLSGETSQERYQSFFDRLSDPERLLDLLRTYPVLARLLTVRLENWCAASCELLRRLVDDWPTLLTTYSPDQNPGVLVGLRSGLGDQHLGGRTVCSLRFASGLRLIYKPQPMGVAVHFQQLVQWLNERGCSPPLRTLKILDRGSHGWVEFVEGRPCRSKVEVDRFYQRQGSLLALLHALGGGDAHSGNFIAQGEHPVLIDFETVIQSRWEFEPGAGALVDFNVKVLRQTVLSVGLLPVPSESNGPDLSGLGSMEDQRFEVPGFAGLRSDKLHFERRSLEFKGRGNQPIWGGKAVPVTDYAEKVHQGFSHTYQLLLKHRTELLASGGPVRRFARDEVRIVLRPTRIYSEFLAASYHPYLLGDALDRQRHFDHLWLDAKAMPRFKELIPLENKALEAGDIPYFSTVLDGRELFAGPREKHRNFFPSSGYQQLVERLRHLSEDSLQQQLALISSALVVHQYNTGVRPPRPAGYRADQLGQVTSRRGTSCLDTSRRETRHRRLLSTAARIGERLETLALRTQLASGKELATWIEPSTTIDDKIFLVPMTAELYGGLSGIVLFLAHLGEIRREERFTALARAGMATLELQLAEDEHGLECVGAFQGWGGLIYALTQLSELWQEPALMNKALNMLERLPDLIQGDERHDIIGGVAGLIPVLLALHRRAPSSRALEIAVLCGQRLLTSAQPQAKGVGWPSGKSGQALTGFSHGASGIAWALFELAHAVRGAKDKRLVDLAHSALNHERTLFDPAAGNWHDLRLMDRSHPAPTAEGQAWPTHWCNGAPGVGLARLGMLRHAKDPKLRAEVKIAIATMMQAPLGISHCLCHGDLGNLELLLQAREVLDEAALDQDIAQRIDLILEDIEENGWRDAFASPMKAPGPSAMEAPGLMRGLSGIGYGLLRCAEPERVPSLLLLAEPGTHPRARAEFTKFN